MCGGLENLSEVTVADKKKPNYLGFSAYDIPHIHCKKSNVFLQNNTELFLFISDLAYAYFLHQIGYTSEIDSNRVTVKCLKWFFFKSFLPI